MTRNHRVLASLRETASISMENALMRMVRLLRLVMVEYSWAHWEEGTCVQEI